MPASPAQQLSLITATIIDERSATEDLQRALDSFSSLCSAASGIKPDPVYQAWSDDHYLDNGVAINPQAAAFCVVDYPRTVMFIRGVYAALQSARQQFHSEPLHILYAGCGPFATLLLPLLSKFKPGQLNITLLDIHQRSLDSVKQLLQYFQLREHPVNTIQADACSYRHTVPLQLIIAETMQKSLEQEPQFMLTANLAPQLCSGGIFIPEKIEVELCLADLSRERNLFEQQNRIDAAVMLANGQRYVLSHLLTLEPAQAAQQLKSARYDASCDKSHLPDVLFTLPAINKAAALEALIFTRIQVFKAYRLDDYESQITLPCPCNELHPLQTGASYQCRYELGTYPRFNIQKLAKA